MRKYDVEDLLADIQAILIANLNAKIAAVEAEKIAVGRAATGLLPIDTSILADGTPAAYFQQTWADKNFDVSPAIFFGIEDSKSTGIGPYTAQEYRLFIEIVYTDNGMDALGKDRIHRYTRAIKEVMEENFDRIPSSAQIKIETIRPISFKLDSNTTEEIKIGGVVLTTALA